MIPVVHFPDSARPTWRHPIAALGNFDGLHRGHIKLIEQVRRRAGERKGTPIAMIFDPHPPKVLRPDKAPPLLMTLEQKLDAFERAGLRGVAIVRFTQEIARWEPEVFVETVLVDWLRVSEVWVGENFLFGRDRSGTFTLLRALGEDLGFRTEKIDPVRYKDFVVSSTRVRHLIGLGRVDEAGALLGHHYFIDGVIVHGDARGRTIGFPTANLATHNDLLPAFGIYATLAVVDDVCHPAVTSVGVRPTIGDGRVTVETFLLNGEHELYGKNMRLAFVKWIREEARFEDLAALQAQIARDCATASEILDKISV
jgi:riboflavin kinase/FMN adenylyltransferase